MVSFFVHCLVANLESTTPSFTWTYLLGSPKNLFFVKCFHVVRTTHLVVGPRFFTLGLLSIEFVNVGGWLIQGGSGIGFLCSVLGRK